MKRKNLNVSVFPFKNLVLFPHASIPLYIFEPVYVEMIEEAVKEKRCVAIGLGDPISENERILLPKKVMGVGRPEIIEKYEDGSLYVIIHGEGKVELGRVIKNSPHLVVEAKRIKEVRATKVPAKIRDKMKDRLFSWLHQNIPDREQRQALTERIESINHVVDYLSLFLVEDREIKQVLLECHSLEERINLLELLLSDGGKKANPFYSGIIREFEHLEYQEKVIVQ